MAKRAIAGKVVVITGASSGIGEAAARYLAARGALVALAARRVERLEALAAAIERDGGQALSITTDVRNEESCRSLIKQVLERWGRIDVLINNAGLGRMDVVGELDSRQVREQVDVNLLGVIWCTNAAVEAMRRQGSGHIITIGSVAGNIGVPTASIYSATKFALEGFHQSLNAELGRSGIALSLVCPGFIATEFNEMLRSRTPDNIFIMPASYVARKLAELIERPRRKIVIPWTYHLITGLSRLFPGLTAWLARLVGPWMTRLRLEHRRRLVALKSADSE